MAETRTANSYSLQVEVRDQLVRLWCSVSLPHSV